MLAYKSAKTRRLIEALEQSFMQDVEVLEQTYGEAAVELMKLQPLNMFEKPELQVLHKPMPIRQEENVDE